MRRHGVYLVRLKKVLKALNKELQKQGIDDVLVVRTGCFGLCSLGPIMIVYPEGSFYSRVTAQEIPEIVDGHLKKAASRSINICIRKQYIRMAAPYRLPKLRFIKNRCVLPCATVE